MKIILGIGALVCPSLNPGVADSVPAFRGQRHRASKSLPLLGIRATVELSSNPSSARPGSVPPAGATARTTVPRTNRRRMPSMSSSGPDGARKWLTMRTSDPRTSASQRPASRRVGSTQGRRAEPEKVIRSFAPHAAQPGNATAQPCRQAAAIRQGEARQARRAHARHQGDARRSASARRAPALQPLAADCARIRRPLFAPWCRQLCHTAYHAKVEAFTRGNS